MKSTASKNNNSSVLRKKPKAKALSQSENRFRELVENASDLIYTTDLQGNFTSLNRFGEDASGYTEKEILQMNFSQIAAPESLELVRGMFAAKLENNNPTKFEAEIIKKDGTRSTLEISSRLIFDDGKAIGVHGIARPVSEARQIAELKRKNEQYQNLFKHANDAIMIFEPETEIIFEVNDKACEMYKRPRGEFVGLSLKNLSQNESLGAGEMGKLLHDGVYDEFESVHLRGDGRAINLVINAALIEYQGQPAILSINRDITARRQTESSLVESERQYRLLGEGIMHQIWTAQPDGNLDYVNQRTLDYFGNTMEQAIGDGWQAVIHPDDLPLCVERWTHALKTGADYEVEFRLKAADGTYRWHSGRASAGRDATGKIIKWFGTNTDIDDQKKAEEMLSKSEERFRSIAETTKEHLAVLDKTGKIIFVNESWRKFAIENGTGEDLKGTGVGTNYLEVCCKAKGKFAKEGKLVCQGIEEVIEGKLQSFSLDYPCHSPIEERWFTVHVSSLNYTDSVIVTHQNITEKKRSEEALRKSEGLYRRLFNNNPYPIWVFDSDTLEFLAVNEAAIEHYGYSREEFLRLTLKDLRAPEQIPLMLNYLKENAQNKEAFFAGQHRTKNGKIIDVEVAAQKITYAQRFATLCLITDVTERKRADKLLQESQQFLKLVIDTLPQAIWWKDRELNFIGCNRFLADAAGFDSPEQMIGLSDYDMPWTTEEADFFRECDRRVMESGVSELNIVEPQLQPDGRRSWLNTNKAPFRNADGEIVGILGSFIDITEQRRADIAMRESEYKLRSLLESMSEGLLQVDNNDSIQFVNHCFCEMTGYKSEELIGKIWTQLLLGDEEREIIKKVNERRLEGLSDRYELPLLTKTGETIWTLIGGAPLFDHENVVTGTMGVFTDITTRKRAEEQLLYDAFHDGLTRLANRALFMDHLRMTIERGKSRHSNLYAVLFLDFDRFKVVNDSLGHAEGDKLLKQIARRLELSTRTGDLAARLGGDEFVILLTELVEEKEAVLVAERIQKSLKKSFNLNGNEIFISASIGIALSTAGHEKPEDMLRDADIAMYRAKAKGKAQHQIFDHTMHEHASKKLSLETEMRCALKNREFLLHYQPIINLETESLMGFEALVRWQHPTRGMVPPFEFIPAAEDSNLILPLGAWILYESCRQLHQWQLENPAASNLTVSVNLSTKQFSQHDLAKQVASALRATRLDARCLKLEITESHLMENSEQAIVLMNSLRALGVELSLDDFGTGYSSLSYLHRLPVTYLKIDRSFVMRMSESEENSEIVSTIIKLAQNLKMRVVAEGIETAEQLAHLKKLNCEFGQGYFFSKPLDAKAAEKFVGNSLESSPIFVNQLFVENRLKM